MPAIYTQSAVERKLNIHNSPQLSGLLKKRGPESANPSRWPLIDELADALAPTWHETRIAGRVRRHTEILRGIAREISNDPERENRPTTAKEAKDRFDAHLRNLAETTPRAGLAAATGDFIDGLIARAARYGDHLFVCFDDPRIPSTTNDLEGFNGDWKGSARHSGGCGSTTNTVVSNLGADAAIALQHIRKPEARGRLRELSVAAAAFLAARAELNRAEAPAVIQRSMLRNLSGHIDRLSQRWFGQDP